MLMNVLLVFILNMEGQIKPYTHTGALEGE